MNFTTFRLLALFATAATICSSASAQEEPIAEAVPVTAPSEKETDTAPKEPAQPESKDEAQDTKPAIRPLTVSADLMGETKITGTLVESTSLQMKTAFGEAQIPLTEIAGVRFPVGDDNSTTVVMLNGDSITGATDLKFLTVETEWGTAKINGQSIVSLLFVPGLQWEGTNSINGKRWALTETRPQSGANQSNPNNSSVGGAPRNSGSATINGVTIQGSGSVPLNAPFGNLNASPQAQPSQPLNIPRFQ